MTDAAKAAGVTSRTLERYLAARPAFKLEVDAARRQGAIIAKHAPAMAARGEVSPPPNSPTGAILTEDDRGWFIDQLRGHVGNPESRGCAKAIDVLGQLLFARDLLAIKAQAKFDADERERDADVSAKPVIIEVPIVDQSSEVT